MEFSLLFAKRIIIIMVSLIRFFFKSTISKIHPFFSEIIPIIHKLHASPFQTEEQEINDINRRSFLR